jgi:hypothetical protein
MFEKFFSNIIWFVFMFYSWMVVAIIQIFQMKEKFEDA